MLNPQQLLLQQQLQQQQQQQQAQQAQQVQQQQLTTIKEVWADNFHQEFQIIRELITHYNYVSFSTEFPGILSRPIGSFNSTNDYHYQTLRTNSDLLNLIQFGISLSDVNGKKPDNLISSWQFNFKFDLKKEMISNESFESLIKLGIDFNKHLNFGIDQFEFAELLTTSGLVLLPNVYWSSFHCGYDFGFLISLLTNNAMPNSKQDFLKLLNYYFPNIFDLKIISKNYLGNPKINSLDNLADELNIPRLQSFLSTGGQALLTNLSFIEIKNRYSQSDLVKFIGIIHGLNDPISQQQNNLTLTPN